MTLAERLCEHCTNDRESDGFGAVLGTTIPLRSLIDGVLGARLRVASGVDVTIPAERCDWQTFDLSDGSVKVAFTDELPIVSAAAGPLRINARLTEIVVRVGAAAIEVQCMLRLPGPALLPRAPFTITIPLA